jgi:hypothetical protein
MLNLLKTLLFLLIFLTWVPSLQALSPQELTPVLGNVDLYHLRNQTYFFPANYSSEDSTIFLPLKRWDLIFTGDRVNHSADTVEWENTNDLIPGPFNHIIVYMGKDSSGLAYGVELNVLSLEQGGGISLICLGSDFGILRHPATTHLQDKRLINRRWARRFVDSAHDRILAHEEALLARVHNDMITGFPYQLEIEHSGNLLDRNIYLVDDGFEGGAGCSDYWTALFEEYAGLCFKNVRMTANELEDYFHNDSQGQLAYVPPEISPFPNRVLVRQLLDLGFRAISVSPHAHACDGSEESGLVLPYLIMENDMLKEIPRLNLPLFPRSWFFR